MNLHEIGWSDALMTENLDLNNLARITAVHRSFCRGVCEKGEINIYLSGRFINSIESEAEKPATGDFVQTSPLFIDEQNQPAAVLEKIVPRKSKISRLVSGFEQVIVANIDCVFILTSVNDDFNINRIQRYALLAQEGGATPILVISKIDLVEDWKALEHQIQQRIPEIEILGVSAIDQFGISDLKAKLVLGSTSVFVGSSGVGKSTLVNLLLGQQVQAVKEIRADDSKGRHTTSSREMFFVPKGGMIIDTAGLREIQVIASEESVSNSFKEVTELLNNCRFNNCSHSNEPGCAINSALDSGDLLKREWDNYLKLQREAAFAESKLSKSLDSNRKKRWKKMNQQVRAQRKFEGKN